MVFAAYEDARATGTAADFGTTPPPNPTTPATFVDGTRLAFSGTASDEFILTLDLARGIGWFIWQEGLPIMNCALLGPGFHDFFEVWGLVELPGSSADPPVVLPAPGYVFRLTSWSDCDTPVQDDPSTWGRLKAIYR
jgi:hypothetical protein